MYMIELTVTMRFLATFCALKIFLNSGCFYCLIKLYIFGLNTTFWNLSHRRAISHVLSSTGRSRNRNKLPQHILKWKKKTILYPAISYNIYFGYKNSKIQQLDYCYDMALALMEFPLSTKKKIENINYNSKAIRTQRHPLSSRILQLITFIEQLSSPHPFISTTFSNQPSLSRIHRIKSAAPIRRHINCSFNINHLKQFIMCSRNNINCTTKMNVMP